MVELGLVTYDLRKYLVCYARYDVVTSTLRSEVYTNDLWSLESVGHARARLDGT